MSLVIKVNQQDGVINFNFETLKKELMGNVERYQNMVVTAETTTIAKKDKADLNKLRKQINDKRIEIKKAFMMPYAKFEDQVKILDSIVGEAISNIDKQVKHYEKLKIEEKTNEVHAFFSEQLKATEIDFIKFENVGLRIGLSNTIKSLKDAIIEYISNIQKDLELISTQNAKERILVEYKRSLNVSEAITKTNRSIAEELALIEKKNKVDEVVGELLKDEISKKPLKAPDEIKKVQFTIHDTVTNIRKVREFMKAEGIKYE